MAKGAFAEIRIVTLEPMRVACYRATGREPEKESLGFLKRWVLRQGVRDPGAVRVFGFDVPVPEPQQRKGVRGYEAWASVPEDLRPGEGVTIRAFPGGLYAVLRVRNPFLDPFRRIPGGWERLMEWSRTNGRFELGSGPGLEEQVQEGRTVDLDLFLPVRPTTRDGGEQPRPKRSVP